MFLENPMYECHITTELPVDTSFYSELAKEHGWKTSYIVGDPLLGDRGFFYFTSYDSNFDRMFSRMERMAMQIPGKVLRKKIEQIVYDTKRKLI